MMKKRNALLLISLMAGLVTHAAVREEWTFDTEATGTLLTNAVNTGVDNNSFVGSGGAGVLEVDDPSDALLSTPSATSLWDDSVTLNADISDAATVRFLRYDLKYDITDGPGEVGNSVGLSFVDGTGTNVAGLVFRYDPDVGTPDPAGKTLTPVTTQLQFDGTLSAIAKVDPAAQSITVWYATDSSMIDTNTQTGVVVTNLTLSSIADLRIRATGAATTNATDFVAVENIRVADTWEEISAGITPSLEATITDVLGGGMAITATNTLIVTIENTGSGAANLGSTLSWDKGAGSFTIVASNNTSVAYVHPGQIITNTYDVRANGPDGLYTLTALCESDATNTSASFLMGVGELLEYAAPYALANDVGGIIPNVLEPGETFDLEVSTQNRGGVTVSNIVNSLTAVDTASFPSISNITSTAYGTLAKAETTSTTYQVTCAPGTPDGWYAFTLINRTATAAWTNEFLLEVVDRALPAVTTNALTITVAPGQLETGDLDLFNDGNQPVGFTITDDGLRAVDSYLVETQAVSRVGFLPAEFAPETVFTWNTTLTYNGEEYPAAGPMPIPFDFSLFGESYTQFGVSQGGHLKLGTPDEFVTLCVFENKSLIDPDTIRYKQEDDRLIVAWGNESHGDELEFQIWLNADGTVQYLYEYGIWGDGNIELGPQGITHTPGQTARDSLLLTPEHWITYAPASGNLAPRTGQALIFTADAANQTTASTNEFTATVNWDTGATEDIAVTVIVEETNPQLDVPPTFAFSGPAGAISPPAIMTVSNSGNVSVSYTITDTGLQAAGYAAEAADFLWTYISPSAEYILDEASLGVEPVEIGFPFIFAGTTHTTLTVGADGTLMLGDDAITPFSHSLFMDGNSSVRAMTDLGQTQFAVTWENVAQPGAGEDQTFQAVLYRTGVIRFNYQQLDGNWTTANVNLRYFSDGGSVTNDLPGTQTLIDSATETTTNVTYETVLTTNLVGSIEVVESESIAVTNVVDTLPNPTTRQSLAFIPGLRPVITASPISGTVQPGANADITLRGDARSLTGGGPTNTITGTTLTFNYEGADPVPASDVTFTASNSVDTVYPALAADPVVQAAMWGSDNPVVSSQQNADGSRTLSWPAAQDSLSRTYTVLYSTNLVDWEWLATVENGTSYVDNEHNDEPVVFYKVTVE